MNIGFDLDGVLCEIDIPIMHLFNLLDSTGEKDAEKYYYNFRKTILNPEDFLHRGDKYYILTARHKDLYNITKAWCDKYCPNYTGLYVVGEKPWYETGESHSVYTERAVVKKAKIIKELDIKIHFEDSPRVVAQLRELLPDVVIVQYAGRL